MIIIHAAQLGGKLILWGEDSDQPSQSDLPPDGSHPRYADAEGLAETAGVAPEDRARAEAGAAIWLPSRGNNPIPSEALAGAAPKSSSRPRKRARGLFRPKLGHSRHVWQSNDVG